MVLWGWWLDKLHQRRLVWVPQLSPRDLVVAHFLEVITSVHLHLFSFLADLFAYLSEMQKTSAICLVCFLFLEECEVVRGGSRWECGRAGGNLRLRP